MPKHCVETIANPAERIRQRALVIKAMGHPSRLAMLEALAEGERCVCELQELVGSDMSTVSKHLGVLKRVGLVEDRREGVWIHYSLRVPCVLRFLDCIDEVLGQTPVHDPGERARLY